jgi:transcriptional regulator with GAF, ATPase, and Fis domain
MLLVTLQNGRFSRLGDLNEHPMDVKLVAGTNVDLAVAVREGRFRADLFARLNPAAALTIPPLRERMKDLETISLYLINNTFMSGPNRELLRTYMAVAGLNGTPKATLAFKKRNEPREGISFVLSRQAASVLKQHAFPGNIRELEFLLANAALFSLSDALHAAESGRALTNTQAKTVFLPEKLMRELVLAPKFSRKTHAIPPGEMAIKLAPAESLRGGVKRIEIQLMERLFEEAGGDFAAMAERLLKGNPDANARKVRLRFNQLGLRAAALRRKYLKR